MNPEELDAGDRILFGDRKKPLEVETTIEDGVIVRGPSGGEYEIYTENDSLLYCRRGNRRYSSYCKNLRKVGEWSRQGDSWIHTDSELELRIEKNQIDKWTLKSEDIDLEEELDLPKYGFSEREVAERQAEKFMEANPEG